MSKTNVVVRFVFAMNVLFLLLLTFSFLYIDRDSDAFVIAVLTLIPLIGVFIVVAALTYTNWEPFDF